jgi:RNA polymerase sigma-70 factor, ECF subfamily
MPRAAAPDRERRYAMTQTAQTGTTDKTDRLRDEIIQYMPHLRGIARLLARDRALAEDLVQETMLRAISHADQFQPGTNLKAWLTTILRNSYFNEKRSQRRLAEYSSITAGQVSVARGQQEHRLQMRDLERAIIKLPAAQREALALVGANGYSYEEAAKMTGCAVGTVKSRVSRARFELQSMLDGGSASLPPPI